MAHPLKQKHMDEENEVEDFDDNYPIGGMLERYDIMYDEEENEV